MAAHYVVLIILLYRTTHRNKMALKGMYSKIQFVVIESAVIEGSFCFN